MKIVWRKHNLMIFPRSVRAIIHGQFHMNIYQGEEPLEENNFN